MSSVPRCHNLRKVGLWKEERVVSWRGSIFRGCQKISERRNRAGALQKFRKKERAGGGFSFREEARVTRERRRERVGNAEGVGLRSRGEDEFSKLLRQGQSVRRSLKIREKKGRNQREKQDTTNPGMRTL